MTISYVGGQVAGRAGSTSSTSITFALTGGSNSTPQPNDLVVITAVVGSAGRTPAQAISGYTALGQLNANGTTYDTSLNVSYKVMGNTPDASFTLPSTGNAADAQRYTVQVWRDVDVSGITSASATGTGTGRPDAPSITPTVAGSVVLLCGGGAAATGASYTGPTNFTTNFLTGATADTNDAMVGSGYWTGWTSGAVNPAAYTGGTTNAADSWAIYSIVLPPAADVARAPLTFVDETHDADNSFGNSSDIATPPTVSIGDLEIIWAAAGALSPTAAPTITTPAGWEYAGNGGSVPAVGGVVNTRVHLFYRISPDTGSNATLSTGTNCAFVWGRLSYSGPDTTHPLRQVVFGADAGGDTSIVLSSLEALIDSTLSDFITLGAAQNITPPGSMTERFDNGTFGSSAADEVTTSTGSTGTRTFTLGSNADAAWGFAEFLGAPTGGGGGPTGTLTVTESGPDTAASSGTVLVQGSASATESGSDAFEASDGKLHFIGTSTGGPVALLTSLDIPPPPGMKAGHRDLLLVGLGAVEPSAAPVIGTSLGSGWEYLGQSAEINIGSGVFALRMAAFARVADGPGSDVTVTSDIAGYWGWHRSAWLNPNASTFIGQTAIFGGVGSSTTPVIPGLTTTKTNSYLLQWQVLGESSVITPPGGTTELDENVPNALGLYGERIPSVSATGSRTYGYSPASDAGYVVLELHSLVSQAAITGTLAVNESGSDTAVIIGGQVVTGTLNATESGSDTAALAGTVLVQGALSVAEAGSDTASLSGNVLVQGALVASEAGADTAALSGAALVQGSLIVTESGSDTFAASGSLSGGINGSLNAVESGSDTFASAGAVLVSGLLSAAEAGADSAVIAGSVVVQGALTVSESGLDVFSAEGVASSRTGTLDATEDGSDTAEILGDGVSPVAGSSLGFELVDHESKSWWKRKPKSLPDAVAKKKLKQVARAIDEIAAEKIEQEEPIRQRDVRGEIAPLLAEMPGFDWRPLFRAVVEYRQQEAARLEAVAQIERIRAIERDDDDVLALLMSF